MPDKMQMKFIVHDPAEKVYTKRALQIDAGSQPQAGETSQGCKKMKKRVRVIFSKLKAGCASNRLFIE